MVESSRIIRSNRIFIQNNKGEIFIPNLYDLAAEYKRFYDFLEEALENDEIADDDLSMYFDTLEAIEEPFTQKAENVVKFLQNIKGDIEAFKTEKLRLERQQRVLQNRFDGLKQWLKDSLEQNKIDNVQAGLFKIRLQKNPPSLEVIDEKKIPTSFIVKTEHTYDKKGMLERLKAGEQIDGVQIAPESKHVRFN